MANINVENAKLIYRNFSGKASQFQPEGKRTCSIILDEEQATQFLELGMNCKQMRIREDEDGNPEPQMYHLPLEAKFANYPPDIYIVMDDGSDNPWLKKLNEDTVACLDYSRITNCDLQIQPYNYEFAGRSGVKAYISKMYVTLEMDDLEDRYSRYEQR